MGFCTALKLALTCSALCLVSVRGRSSRFHMVSMDVSFVIPPENRFSWLRFAPCQASVVWTVTGL